MTREKRDKKRFVSIFKAFCFILSLFINYFIEYVVTSVEVLAYFSQRWWKINRGALHHLPQLAHCNECEHAGDTRLHLCLTIGFPPTHLYWDLKERFPPNQSSYAENWSSLYDDFDV